MTGILETLRQRASRNKKRILLPETGDPRVREAIGLLHASGPVTPVALTGGTGLPDGLEAFETHPEKNLWLERVIEHVRNKRGISRAQAEKSLSNPLVLSCYLLAAGYVDGGVAGSVATTANVLKAGLKALGTLKDARTVSSVFLMDLPSGRVLTYGDCGVIPDPKPEQLADIACFAARTHARLTGETPHVAMLSFSTCGSASHADIDRVKQATALVRQKAPDLIVDGELQFDAAFNPAIGAVKAPDSPVAGKANVFVFPDLDAGNIGYKITQEIGGARAIGPILGGFPKPWMDLSRGCSVQDIVDVAVIAALVGDD